MGPSRGVTGLLVTIVTWWAMGMALAQDKTWNECELADRDPDRSIAACSKILARSSSRAHAAAFHNRGLAFKAKGNLDQAISDISRGIRLDPQRTYRWQERGELYTKQGKYQQAIDDITEAIRLDPTPRAFRFQARAEAYRGLGDLPQAIADFDEAIRLDPVPRSFRFSDRGNALRDAGQFDRALADYETALKLAPTNAWILLERGRTYTRMGRTQAAKSDFDNALTLDPSNEELRRVVGLEVAMALGKSPPYNTLPSQEMPPPALPPKEASQEIPPQTLPPKEADFARRVEDGCDFSTQVRDAAIQTLAGICEQMNKTYRPTEPSKSTRDYLADFLYGIEIKLYGPQIRAKQPYPRDEMKRLWDFTKNTDIPTVAACFPGYDEMVYEARRRNATKLTARLFDVYRSWMYVYLCNQARAGYLAVFVNDIELERARKAVKAIEVKFKTDDPELDINQVWNDAGRQSRIRRGRGAMPTNARQATKHKPRWSFRVTAALSRR